MEISKLKVGDSAFGAIPTYNGAFQKGWKVKKFIVVRKSAKMIEEVGCSEKGCMNRFYSMDRLTPFKEIPLCRKHYRMYALGYSEYDASR